MTPSMADQSIPALIMSFLSRAQASTEKIQIDLQSWEKDRRHPHMPVEIYCSAGENFFQEASQWEADPSEKKGHSMQVA